MKNYIPGMIVDSIVRQDGTDELIGVATVTLPDIENVTEEVKGLGIDAFNEVVSNAFGAMTLGMKFTGPTANVGFSKQKTTSLVITSAIATYNKETHEEEQKKLVCSIKGKLQKRTGGELGKAVKNEPELEFSVTYYKLELDGVVLYEIDKFNKKAIIDGEDLYSATNSILG